MKRRVMSIMIAIAMCFTCAFVLPATSHTEDSFAKSKSKYVKIKRTKYNKMKTTIANQSNAINSYKTTVADQKATIAEQKLQLSEKDSTIKDKKQTISWLWSTLEDFGYFYNYDTHKWESDGTAEPTEEPQSIENVDLVEDDSQIEIIRQETGLTIDCVQLIEGDDNWSAYYVYADGDIYVITVKEGHVAVKTQLN